MSKMRDHLRLVYDADSDRDESPLFRTQNEPNPRSLQGLLKFFEKVYAAIIVLLSISSGLIIWHFFIQ